MAWETRQRGGRYYTRSKRVGGKVRREYIGGGPAGELAAMADAEDREEREAAREAERERRRELEQIDREAGDFLADLALGIRAGLVAKGCRRRRREWRVPRVPVRTG